MKAAWRESFSPCGYDKLRYKASVLDSPVRVQPSLNGLWIFSPVTAKAVLTSSFPVLLVPLKASRSMTPWPPQGALARLWLEPPPLQAAESFWAQLWTCRWGGCYLEMPWTLWSKGQCLASPARGHAGSHALPHWRFTEVVERSKEKPHVDDLSVECHVHVHSLSHTFQISEATLNKRRASDCVFFLCCVCSPALPCVRLHWTNASFCLVIVAHLARLLDS